MISKKLKQLSLGAGFLAMAAMPAITSADDDHDDRIDTGVISPCQYLIPTANLNPAAQPVCVDVPVKLKKPKVVFNMDHNAFRSDGVTPIGMRHMVMLSNAIKTRIDAGVTKAENVSVIGVFHGGPAAWVLSNEWWAENVVGATGNPYAGWLNKLAGLKAMGVNIQIEICGVTMTGKGWTNDMLYPGVVVNQGAIGRLIDLQLDDYAMIQPGK